MSTKDAIGNGNAAMKEAAMKSLSKEAADSAESSARRTARASARREPCMLNGHSRTKVRLEPGSIGKEPDVDAVRAGSTARVKRGQTLGCRTVTSSIVALRNNRGSHWPTEKQSHTAFSDACRAWHRRGACG